MPRCLLPTLRPLQRGGILLSWASEEAHWKEHKTEWARLHREVWSSVIADDQKGEDAAGPSQAPEP
eukprot:CAMPEP_0202749496 /NCGR_PEP_ID=MMETSP1388-20130828/10569_1 /ASSEMBLY_ACC=CAM_ASM_000864 /TAXON_ID=37098 /ORGANISM="Isochrysis sp, Strain CCMP1244" /LENGTH=65 /DNA_ID=CAMNT_0049416993 /DNA_START=106 /DNA_END=303 /DNA_ORIENTATION=-